MRRSAREMGLESPTSLPNDTEETTGGGAESSGQAA